MPKIRCLLVDDHTLSPPGGSGAFSNLKAISRWWGESPDAGECC